MAKFSDAYYACLAAAIEHHATSKTYSGKLFRPHARYVYDMLQRLQAKTVLDYGCGKGSQYKWISHGGDATVPAGLTIEQFWGVEVHKYDPAWPPFAAMPAESFDVVLCTHTLGTIPVQDLDAVIHEVIDFAKKGVFFAEKIGDPNKQVYADLGYEMPHGWQRGDWEAVLRKHLRDGIEIVLATRENGSHGTIVTREVLR
jgi:SAM-dependent methyltransferase